MVVRKGKYLNNVGWRRKNSGREEGSIRGWCMERGLGIEWKVGEDKRYREETKPKRKGHMDRGKWSENGKEMKEIG